MNRDISWSKLLLYSLSILFLAVGIIVCFWVVDYENVSKEETPDTTRESDKRREDDQDEMPVKKNDIPFTKYKEFYEDYPVVVTENQISGHCQGKGSLVEFVFLWKNKKNEFDPYPIRSYGIWRSKEANNVGVPSYGGINPQKTIRFLVPVGKNCEQSLYPGTKYVLKEINENEIYHYSIELPSQSELKYRNKFEGFDMVYRYPILMNKVVKTKKKTSANREEKQTFTLRVRGVGKITNHKKEIKVKYLNDGEAHQGTPLNDHNEWVFPLVSTSKKDVLGGSVAIYEQHKETLLENADFDLQDYIPDKLLKYKKRIQTLDVNMDKSLDFHHKQQHWIKDSIHGVGEMIIERMGKEPKNKSEWLSTMTGSTVKLSIGDPNRMLEKQRETFDFLQNEGNTIHMSAGAVYRQEDSLNVTLNAPEGTYDLFWNDYLLEEGFSWPPQK
jgi:hypothetical protein